MRRISHYPRRDGKLLAGARYVGRPSRWGNPYKIGETGFVPVIGRFPDGETRPVAQVRKLRNLDEVIDAYRVHVALKLKREPGWLDPLRAAPALACACPLDQPCHADVLVEAIKSGFVTCPVHLFRQAVKR